MPTLSYPLISNYLIDLLPNHEQLLLLQHTELVQLSFGTSLCEANQAYDYLYFPLSGFISLAIQLKGHKPLEMGLIGNEGMLGATLLLGINLAPTQAIVQGNGSALRISVAAMQLQLSHSPHLRHVIQRYLFVLMSQLSQNAACLHFHELEHRLARWLLMSHNRAHSNSFHLTHQFLADMLGVRRSGVTVAAGNLQQQQIISYSRGVISVLNRRALKTVACACYQDGIINYVNMLGQPTKDSAQRLLAEQGTP